MHPISGMAYGLGSVRKNESSFKLEVIAILKEKQSFERNFASACPASEKAFPFCACNRVGRESFRGGTELSAFAIRVEYKLRKRFRNIVMIYQCCQPKPRLKSRRRPVRNRNGTILRDCWWNRGCLARRAPDGSRGPAKIRFLR